ncbi:uncharacterized protein EI90DRAFT_3029591 [Cantharellus anzutake]|uniref:uncharacterized protein n=1 Tax=Cantharellus anzutake TaxID=1750568 RepID=UPI00190841C8|nr:uncharacterized protein EI90DRAFT_3029591 [Cantharellus anzutake]KAF8342609.1 hypothetical protein EI90DRAFT_3029591 [Cantharellus anzutake]
MTAKRGITLVAPMPPSKRPRNNDKQNHPPLSIAEELSDNTLESEAEDVNNGVAIKEHNHSPQDGGNGDVDVPNLLPPSRLVSDAGGDEKVEDSATSSLAADKSKESQLDAELSPERLADNFWTRLTTTPWEANEKEKASRSRVRGGDGVFKDKDQWEPALVQRLYSMTSFDAIVDDGVGAIECFTPGDSKFVFTGKPLSLGYRRASQNIKAGQALRFLFTGVVKDAHQWSDNYMLNLVPLTRLGFKRAKEVLKYYSSKKVHALAIEEHFIPLKAWTLVVRI